MIMAVWIIATVAVCGRVALTKPSRQDLFPVYQNAGQEWLNGQDLYRNSKFNYRYSPLFAAAMTLTARRRQAVPRRSAVAAIAAAAGPAATVAAIVITKLIE